MKIRVLMIGPGEEVMGGISTLVATILPLLQQYTELSYLATVRRRPISKSGRISVQNMALAISQYGRFLLALLRFRPHVIHLHTSEGIAWLKDTFFVVVARAFQYRIILHMHGGNFVDIYNRGTSLMQFYSRKVLKLASAVIEVSAERKRRLARMVPKERISTFRNCINVDAAQPRSSDWSTNNAKALFLGIVGPSKGAFDLLEAMGYVKSKGCSLQLWMAGHEEGDGDLARARAQLQELNLQDTCQLAGPVRGDKKVQLLREASLFVLPSYQEALPMSILEAMAVGLPVVATAVGGVPEIVEDAYNGFLVAPGDTKALAEKLILLADDKHLRKVMGQRSREIAERELATEPYVRRLVELYESLLKL